MATLREKIGTKWVEGLEAARHLIREKVGENAVLGEPGSVYHYDLRREARDLEVQLDLARDDVSEFLSKSATGPTASERRDQRQLDMDDAIAAEIGREKQAAKKAKGLDDDQVIPEASEVSELPTEGPGDKTVVEEAVAKVHAKQLDEIFEQGSRIDTGLSLSVKYQNGKAMFSNAGEHIILDLDVAVEALRGVADGAGRELAWLALCGVEGCQLKTGDEAEEEVSCPVGVSYLDTKDRFITVVELDRDQWRAVHRKEGDAINKLIPRPLKVVGTQAEAQVDLDAYAAEKGWVKITSTKGEAKVKPKEEEAQAEPKPAKKRGSKPKNGWLHMYPQGAVVAMTEEIDRVGLSGLDDPITFSLSDDQMMTALVLGENLLNLPTGAVLQKLTRYRDGVGRVCWEGLELMESQIEGWAWSDELYVWIERTDQASAAGR